MHVLETVGFGWLEGDRLFSVVFGTVLSGTCFALAYPTLYAVLPKSRAWLYPRETDPRQVLQCVSGIVCMSMVFTNALCRYIPHRTLGDVHPVFFLTTLALVALLGPRVLNLVRKREPEPMRYSFATAFAVVVALVAFPLSAVINAFFF